MSKQFVAPRPPARGAPAKPKGPASEHKAPTVVARAASPADISQTPSGSAPPTPGGRSEPLPADLATLLVQASEKASLGVPQREIVEWVQYVAAQFGIRTRHDEYPTGSAPSAGPAALPDLDDPAPPPRSVAPSEIEAPSAPASPPVEVRVVPISVADDVDPLHEEPITPLRKSRGARAKRQLLRVPIHTTAAGDHVIVLEQILHPRFGQPRPDRMVGRIVLSADRQRVTTRIKLCSDCNGAVIDARSWVALALPPNTFNVRLKPAIVDKFLAEGAYDVIRVEDGTIVTLYSWEHPDAGTVWSIATSNGYDVSTYRWMGAKTFAEVVHEVLSRYPEFVEASGMTLRKMGGMPRLRFERLDTTRSFTLGFRHPDFHPLRAGEGDAAPRAWQIQSADRRTLRVLHEDALPGVPMQELLAEEEVDGVRVPFTIESLMARCKNSLAAAVELIAAAAAKDAPSPAAEGKPAEEKGAAPFVYGFILRTRDRAKTGEHSDFLIGSPLQQRVKELMYNREPRHMQDQMATLSRLDYNAMRAFLIRRNQGDFLKLFPQFTDKFREYRDFTDSVTATILDIFRQTGEGGPLSRLPLGRRPSTKVAKMLHEFIAKNEPGFNTRNLRDARSVVHDYVMDPNYAVVYLRAMALGNVSIPGSQASSEPGTPHSRR